MILALVFLLVGSAPNSILSDHDAHYSRFSVVLRVIR